jgi:hypothetical protein
MDMVDLINRTQCARQLHHLSQLSRLDGHDFASQELHRCWCACFYRSRRRRRRICRCLSVEPKTSANYRYHEENDEDDDISYTHVDKYS